MIRKKYVISASVLILGLLLLLVLSFLTVPNILLMMRFSHAKTPELYTMPVSREIRKFPASPGNTKEVSIFGLHFLSPWGDYQIKGATESIKVLSFSDNRTVTVCNKYAGKSITESLNKTFSSEQKKVYKKLFGSKALDSDFYLAKSDLSVTPHRIKLFTPRKEAGALSAILALKYTNMPPYSAGGIYVYDNEDLNAIQFGVPGKSKLVTLRIYDSRGVFYSLQTNGKNLSQDDVDLILQSLRIGG